MDVLTRGGLPGGYYTATARVVVNYSGPSRASASAQCSIRQSYDGFLDVYDVAGVTLSTTSEVLVPGTTPGTTEIGYVPGKPNGIVVLVAAFGVSPTGTLMLTCERTPGSTGDAMVASSATWVLTRVDGIN